MQTAYNDPRHRGHFLRMDDMLDVDAEERYPRFAGVPVATFTLQAGELLYHLPIFGTLETMHDLYLPTLSMCALCIICQRGRDTVCTRYLPAGWAHQVETIGNPSIAINHWWRRQTLDELPLAPAPTAGGRCSCSLCCLYLKL